MTANILLYTKENCPYCVWAKELLTRRQLSYTEIRIDLDPQKLSEMLHLTQRRTVPQIIINGQAIGGFDDLKALETSGQLEILLSAKEK